ncbi:permease [Halorutilales archaeon Cl-col2-1]
MDRDDLPDNVLFDWYLRYIGEPDAKTDVYAGFGIFLGGIALGLLSLVIFLPSTATEVGSDLYWTLRETSISMAIVGLPLVMLGVAVLLPVRKRAVYAAVTGTAVCVVGVVMFASSYPSNFNVDQSVTARVVSVYAVGLALVVSSTGAALIAHHLEKARGVGERSEESETETDTRPKVSQEDVESDIEEAMSTTEISWGGVEKKETKRLSLDVDTEISGQGFDVDAEETRASGSAVDEAVSGLKNLKGGETKEAKGGSTDDQTEALRQLRNQGDAESGSEGVGGVKTDSGGLVDKIRRWLT